MNAVTGGIIAILVVLTDAVPPHVCHANFRWEDCGKPPQPVVYYWKPGSRCEIGIWRGCLPNVNMFKDEYECVSTCIFSLRAEPEDYHKQKLNMDVYDMEDTTDDTTIDMDLTNTTDNYNATDSNMTGETLNSTVTSDMNSTDTNTAGITGGNDGGTTGTGTDKNGDGTTEAGNPGGEQEPENEPEPERRKGLKDPDDHENHP